MPRKILCFLSNTSQSTHSFRLPPFQDIPVACLAGSLPWLSLVHLPKCCRTCWKEFNLSTDITKHRRPIRTGLQRSFSRTKVPEAVQYTQNEVQHLEEEFWAEAGDSEVLVDSFSCLPEQAAKTLSHIYLAFPLEPLQGAEFERNKVIKQGIFIGE